MTTVEERKLIRYEHALQKIAEEAETGEHYDNPDYLVQIALDALREE